MLVSLFVVMSFMSGSTITYKYSTQMDQFQCEKQAVIEAEKMDKNDNSDLKKVDIICMSDKNFVSKYL